MSSMRSRTLGMVGFVSAIGVVLVHGELLEALDLQLYKSPVEQNQLVTKIAAQLMILLSVSLHPNSYVILPSSIC